MVNLIMYFGFININNIIFNNFHYNEHNITVKVNILQASTITQ